MQTICPLAADSGGNSCAAALPRRVRRRAQPAQPRGRYIGQVTKPGGHAPRRPPRRSTPLHSGTARSTVDGAIAPATTGGTKPDGAMALLTCSPVDSATESAVLRVLDTVTTETPLIAAPSSMPPDAASDSAELGHRLAHGT